MKWNTKFLVLQGLKAQKRNPVLVLIRLQAEQIQAGAGLPNTSLHGCEYLQECQDLQGMKEQKHEFSLIMKIRMTKANIFSCKSFCCFQVDNSKVPNLIILKALELDVSYFEFRNLSA